MFPLWRLRIGSTYSTFILHHHSMKSAHQEIKICLFNSFAVGDIFLLANDQKSSAYLCGRRSSCSEPSQVAQIPCEPLQLFRVLNLGAEITTPKAVNIFGFTYKCETLKGSGSQWKPGFFGICSRRLQYDHKNYNTPTLHVWIYSNWFSHPVCEICSVQDLPDRYKTCLYWPCHSTVLLKHYEST